jgi:transketolase
LRTAFINELCLLAKSNSSLWLLCGDLGYSVVEAFEERFADRFVNVGIAEQNMTGMAAGLAMTGKHVFTYSIGNFPVFRCLEQIRNDVCYHNLPVTVVAVGGGVAYGSQGYTHHAVEDLAVMRILPHMRVIAPGDPIEVRLAVRAIVKNPGPSYIRLGKANEPIIHQTEPHFEIGKAIELCCGDDLTLISTGGMLGTVKNVSERLKELKINARVLSMHTVHPVDSDAILKALQETSGIITIEEHGLGGLGSAVSEVIAESGISTKFKILRLPSIPFTETGSQDALRRLAGLSTDGILAQAIVHFAEQHS